VLNLDNDAISTPSSRTGRDRTILTLRTLRKNFNPLFPHGKRPRTGRECFPLTYFNPLFPHGKRLPAHGTVRTCCDFNPLFPHGKRLMANDLWSMTSIISTPSSRTGRDEAAGAGKAPESNFNPLFPHGKRRSVQVQRDGDFLFQPPLPAREETL